MVITISGPKPPDVEGGLWVWGPNKYGDLGMGPDATFYEPTKLDTASDWTGVFAGQRHGAAIKSDGTVWVWGMNGGGQLGLGDKVTRSFPALHTLSGASRLAFGSVGALFLGVDGRLFSSGTDTGGGLGQGKGVYQVLNPMQVGSDTNWRAIDLSVFAAHGVKADGTLWGWGRNPSAGKPGQEAITNRKRVG